MLAIYKDASKGHLDSDSVSVNQDGQCHGQHLASILYLWTFTIPLSCIYHASTIFYASMLPTHFYCIYTTFRTEQSFVGITLLSEQYSSSAVKTKT